MSRASSHDPTESYTRELSWTAAIVIPEHRQTIATAMTQEGRANIDCMSNVELSFKNGKTAHYSEDGTYRALISQSSVSTLTKRLFDVEIVTIFHKEKIIVAVITYLPSFVTIDSLN